MIEPNQPTTPTENKPCCQPTPFLLMVLSVLVIAGSLCVGVTIGRGQTRPTVAEPTTTSIANPTAGWTEYTSEFYKITLSYPENMRFYHQDVFNDGSQETLTFENDNGYMSIETGKALNLSNLPIQGIVTIFGSPINRYDQSIDGNQKVYLMNVPLEEEGKSFAISIHIKSEAVVEELDLFDQILSTFKFTDQTQTIPAAISDLFNSLNQLFGSSIAPTQVNTFIDNGQETTQSAWKLDLNSVAKDKPDYTKIINLFENQLKYKTTGGADGADGGYTFYESSLLKCDCNLFSNDNSVVCVEK